MSEERYAFYQRLRQYLFKVKYITHQIIFHSEQRTEQITRIGLESVFDKDGKMRSLRV